MARNDVIKFPRGALADDLWCNPNMARLMWYLMCRSDTQGSVSVGVAAITKDLNLTRQTVRTLIGCLERRGVLSKVTEKSLTYIMLDFNGFLTRSSGQASVATAQVHDDYVDPRFADAWALWLRYRSETKNNYKSDQSRRIGYEELIRKSNSDPNRAMAMVKSTIANGYKGLHGNREDVKQHTATNESARRAEGRSRMSTLATEIVSRPTDIQHLYNGCIPNAHADKD